MNPIRHLPNALTSMNLLCGCLGTVVVFEGATDQALWFVMVACVFDFLDGFTARLLGVTSPIGKELDSLADMVTFGVLPSLTLYRMIDTLSSSAYLPYVAFLVAIFSALRLAKFNIDENQKEVFIGLPTPANALFITSLLHLPRSFDMLISSDYALAGIAILFSFLLVAPIELFALKFKTFGWKDNQIKFTFLAFSVLLLSVWQLSALPFIILTYVAVSLLKNGFSF